MLCEMEAAFAICVSGRLPVTPLHCVVDMRVAPEEYRFIPKVCPSSVVNQCWRDGNFSYSRWQVNVRLGGDLCEQAAADRDYEKRRARRSNPVNAQSAVK